MLKKIFFCLPWILFATDQPLPYGNFSVPTVNQIAPLVSFGQLLIGEKALLLQLGGAYGWGHKKNIDFVNPNVIYGIRDDLSISVAVPFTPISRDSPAHSAGFYDLFVQLEYGYYNFAADDHTIQATIVGNVQFPTGSSSKNPPTGNGWFAYFLGTTAEYTSFNWYAFASTGVNLPTQHHKTRFGLDFLYQCGFARYIAALSPPGWIFDIMVEFDGIYMKKDKRDGKIDPNSGGNTILVTPSLWLSSNRFVILNGHQHKINYTFAYNFGIAWQF
jgi:hypothetical protein